MTGSENTFWRSRLGRRVLMSFILFSSVVTFVLFLIEIVLEYRLGSGQIDRRLTEIERSYAGSIADRVWAMDRLGIELLTTGISKLPAIRYVAIEEYGRKNDSPVATGTRLSTDVVQRDIPLVCDCRGKHRLVGSLHVEATLTELYGELARRALIILIQQAFKTLVVASFFLFILHRIITRRILNLSGLVASFGGMSAENVLRETGKDDEIDRLQTAFEVMKKERRTREAQQKRLNRVLLAIGKANQHLGSAVEEDELLNRMCDALVVRGEYRAASIGLLDHGGEPVARAGDWTCLEATDHSSIGLWLKDADGRTFGGLALHSREQDGFNADEVALLAEFAGNLAASVLARRERQRRAETERQLLQAQKGEALGQLAGNVAHDFNNVLGAILGFAEFIVTDTPPESPTHRHATRIVAAGQRGKSLIARILSFARRTDLRSEKFSLAQLLDEIQTLLAGSIPATTRLVVSSEPGEYVIAGDQTQIVQMLVNLCINAHHALDGQHGEVSLFLGHAAREGEAFERLCHRNEGVGDPGTVETWTREGGQACAVAGRLHPGRQYHVVRVSDTGCGMDEALLGQIFEPFFTTKEVGHGTGLGLPMIHGTALAHDGALAVQSRPGKGTVFEIFLPAAGKAEPQSADVAAAGDTVSTPEGSAGRILLVDDDQFFGEMLFYTLERRGFEVTRYTDPREALSAFDKMGSAWDILVTDQTMPHMTGLDLIRALRNRKVSLHCILCTGFAEANLGTDMLKEAGVSTLLRKPIEPAKLNEALALATADRHVG